MRKLSVEEINTVSPYRFMKIQRLSPIEAYEYSSDFTCMTTSLRDAEGVFNSATLIIPTAHPQYVEILSEFTETSAILRDKSHE